jgi:hypothetical protein
MQKDILTSLARLSDDELAARVRSLAMREHNTAACVIAHLAEMDTRDIHLRAGYPRLYDYCLKVLHLSEWEAWNRIEAGRVARRFPMLFDMLEEGSIHLTGIKLLAPHLTDENHRKVLESARWKSKLAIGEIVARLHPRPDVPTSVVPILEFGVGAPVSTTPPPDATSPTDPPAPVIPSAMPPPQPAQLTPLSPRRYKLQLTISGERSRSSAARRTCSGTWWRPETMTRFSTVPSPSCSTSWPARSSRRRTSRDRAGPGVPAHGGRPRRSCASSGSAMKADASTRLPTAIAARRRAESNRTTSTRGCSPAARTTRTTTSCAVQRTTTMKGGSISVGAAGRARPPVTARTESVNVQRHTARDRSGLN